MGKKIDYLETQCIFIFLRWFHMPVNFISACYSRVQQFEDFHHLDGEMISFGFIYICWFSLSARPLIFDSFLGCDHFK